MSFELISDKEFLRRLEISMSHIDSNCVGTALFLSGMKKEDVYESPSALLDLGLNKLRRPRKGCLVALVKTFEGEDFIALHSGIVIISNPLTITHRADPGQPVYHGVSFPQFLGGYIRSFPEVRYYEPRKLDQ